MAFRVSQHTYELPHQYPFSWEVRDCVQQVSVPVTLCVRKHCPMEIIPTMSLLVTSNIFQLLKKNPKNRICDLQGLLQQAFFIDLNFEAVIKKEVSYCRWSVCILAMDLHLI